MNKVGLGFEPGEHLLWLHIFFGAAFLAAPTEDRAWLLHVDVDHSNSESEFKFNTDYQDGAVSLC